MFLKVVSKRPESGPWVSKHYYPEVITPCFHFYGVHFTGRWIPRAVNQKSSCFLACSVFRQPRWWWCFPRLTEAVICVSEQQHEVKCWMDLMRAALCGFFEVSSGHQPIKNCDVCWIVWFPHREITSVWWVMSLELKRFEVDLFNVSRQHWGDTNVRANHPEGGCCLMRITGWKGAALYKDKSKRPLIADLLQAQGRTPTKNIFSYYISDNKPPGSKRQVR